MKIKAVCARTELTDRTVRHYIEEGLISPAYTENYLGRKTFTFSEADVDLLRSIAVLRKFGFSIPEIKEMLSNPTCIAQTVEALRQRKQTVIDEEQALLAVLARLDGERAYTVTELAAVLSAPVAKSPLPAEDLARHILRSILSFLWAALTLLIVWLPVALVAFVVIEEISFFHYPVVNAEFIWLTSLFLLPTVFSLVFPMVFKKTRRKFVKVIVKAVLLILCVSSLPSCFLCALGIIDRSETADIDDYRQLDATCLANTDSIFQEMFPVRADKSMIQTYPDGHAEYVDLDAHYYYRYIEFFDYTYDIYAEWPLKEGEIDNEISRISNLFSTYQQKTYFRFHSVQKENYECLILSDGPLFKEASNSYPYYIFAYDRENLRVRYLFCDSLRNGADQPYYLSLDW